MNRLKILKADLKNGEDIQKVLVQLKESESKSLEQVVERAALEFLVK